MPLLYRVLLTLLGAVVLLGGVAGVWAGARLDDGAQLRGVTGGLIASAIGIWLLRLVLATHRPRWLVTLFGDVDESE